MDGEGSTRALGALGEDAALAQYRRAGYRLIARNWRCRLGEVDLIVARGRTLVFCEVKARRGSSLGGPFDAVTWRKQGKLRSLAEAFLTAAGTRWDEIRFDVASVMVRAGQVPLVHLFESAF